MIWIEGIILKSRFPLATNGDGFLASERVRSKPCDNLFTCSSTYVAKRSNVYIGLSAAAGIVQTSGQAAFQVQSLNAGRVL